MVTRVVMHRKTWVLIVAVCLLCAVGWISGAGPRAAAQSSLRLVNPGYFTLATHGTLPPEITVGPGDTLGGMDGVLYNAFVKDHGLKLKLFETTFSSMILAVEQGKVDGGEGVFYTENRAKHVYYTYPFYVSRTVIFTLKSFPYTGPASMEGKRVATIIGYVWAPYLQKWSAPGTALFPDEVTTVQALLNGQVQGYVNGVGGKSWPGVVHHDLHEGDFGFPKSVLENVAYNIVNCKNRDIAAALDAELTKLHKSGEWMRALKAHDMGPEDDAVLQSPKQICGGG